MPSSGGSSSYFRVGDNIELWRVVVFLCVLIVFVMILEQIMHHAEHALAKYPKYHEMLSKIYRELMILGLLGLGIKIVKELALVDAYGKNIMAFQVADLIVFISAFALIIQAICVFSLLRNKNKQLDRDELVNTIDLIKLVKRHQALLRGQSWLRRLWPWTKAPATSSVTLEGSSLSFSTARYDEMVATRTLRHFFLRKYQLPELFPFSKYLRQAQDHQITHMIDIEMSMWILIFLTWVLDASTVLLENLNHEVERHALVTMFMLFSWVLTLLHVVVAMYLRGAVKKILEAAGYTSHKDMLTCLQIVAADETRNLETQKPDVALEMMHKVQEEQESKEHGKHSDAGHSGGGGGDGGGHGGGCLAHDTGFQLLSLCCRRLCRCRQHHSHGDAEESGDLHHDKRHAQHVPEVKIRFFSRIGIHFLVKFLIMVNGFYVALMVQAVLYEMPEIYATFGVLPALLIPLPLLLNMFVFQPQICRNFVTVSCIFKVDVATLSEVITHFSETVELRADFVTCLKQSMKENGLGIEELRAEFRTRDPTGSGCIELEELRQVLRAFGCHISFYRFNAIAKLLVRLRGTRVEYAQIERLLVLADDEDLEGSKHQLVGAGYNKYLHSIIHEVSESHRRSRLSTALRISEDIVMMESASFSRQRRSSHQHNQHSEPTGRQPSRFGLPRFSASRPTLAPTEEVDETNSSTRAQDRDGGVASVRGGHGYDWL